MSIGLHADHRRPAARWQEPAETLDRALTRPKGQATSTRIATCDVLLEGRTGRGSAFDILDDGRGAGNFTELEVELVEGGENGDLRWLSRALRRAGAMRSDVEIEPRKLAIEKRRTSGHGLRFLRRSHGPAIIPAGW